MSKLNAELEKIEHPQGNAPREKVAKILKRFLRLQEMRDKPFRFFNNLALNSYVDASIKRFNLYQEQPQYDEDWQAKTVMGTTRNKGIALLSQMMGQRTDVDFFDQSRSDMVRPRLAKALWTGSLDREEELGRDTEFNIALSAMEKGTAVVYEGFTTRSRKIKKIESYNPQTGESTWTEVEIYTYNDAESVLVNLLEFYPGDLAVQNPQDMPDCAWRTFVDIDVFKNDFSGWKDADKVRVGATSGNIGEEEFFRSFTTQDRPMDKVEVIRYFSRVDDEYHILANGILLTELVNPLPWQHKMRGKGLPFWVVRFEPIDEDFFYGMSLPFKLKGQQDVVDVAYRMLINSTLLALNPPILTDDSEFPEENFLFPGQVRYMEAGRTVQPMQMKEPGESAYRLIQMAGRDMDESSISDVASGQLSDSGRRTATEIMESQKSAQRMIFLFLRGIEKGTADKAYLRMSNIIQFYGLPMTPDGKKVEYRKLRVKNMPLLLSPSKGTIEINFVPSKGKLPPTQFEADPAQVVAMYGVGADEVSVIADPDTGLEKVFLTSNALMEMTLGLRVIPNSSVKMNEGLQVALFDDFEKGAMTYYPDLVDRKKLFKRKAEIRNENPEDFLLEPDNLAAAPSPTGLDALGMPAFGGGQPGGMGETSSQMLEGFGGGEKSTDANLMNMVK